jgi:hypothetical protein
VVPGTAIKTVNKTSSISKSSSCPLTVAAGVHQPTKNPKTGYTDAIFTEYGIQKDQQARMINAGIRRYNRAMENIAKSSASIEMTKTNLEIGALSQPTLTTNGRVYN